MRGAIEAAIGRHIKHWQEGGPLARGLVSGMTDDALKAIEPMLGKLIGDAQASEGELMREAGYRAGYKKGYDDASGKQRSMKDWQEGYDQGCMDGSNCG